MVGGDLLRVLYIICIHHTDTTTYCVDFMVDCWFLLVFKFGMGFGKRSSQYL